MAESITDKIHSAIYTNDRAMWLDPEDAREISEDVAKALGYNPTDDAPEQDTRPEVRL